MCYIVLCFFPSLVRQVGTCYNASTGQLGLYYRFNFLNFILNEFIKILATEKL